MVFSCVNCPELVAIFLEEKTMQFFSRVIITGESEYTKWSIDNPKLRVVLLKSHCFTLLSELKIESESLLRYWESRKCMVRFSDCWRQIFYCFWCRDCKDPQECCAFIVWPAKTALFCDWQLFSLLYCTKPKSVYRFTITRKTKDQTMNYSVSFSVFDPLLNWKVGCVKQ